MSRYTGHNVRLKLGDGASPEAFTQIAQVLNISGPSMSRDTIDTTDADSTNDWRTFEPSYIDPGEITVEVNFDPGGATHMYASGGALYDYAGTSASNYQIVFEDSSPDVTWSFTAKVSGFEPASPHDGVLTASITYKVMGAITLA